MSNNQKPGLRKIIQRKATSIFIPKKKPQVNLSRPAGETGVYKIRKAKSVADLTKATEDLSLSPKLHSVAVLTAATEDLALEPADLPPPVPRLPTYLANQPLDYARSSGWAKPSVTPSTHSSRLLSQRSTPMLRNKASGRNLRARPSTRNFLRTVNEHETADEWLDRINNTGGLSRQRHNDHAHVDITENRQFFDSYLDRDTAEDPSGQEMQDSETVCDLSKLDNITITLAVRILDIATSNGIAKPRDFDACSVRKMSLLRAEVIEKSWFNLDRVPVMCEFMFNEGRELEWKEGDIVSQNEVYQDFLEGLKSQGERTVLVQNDVLRYEMNETGLMKKPEMQDLEVVGHISLYYR